MNQLRTVACAIAVAASLGAASASATSITVDVGGTQGPWLLNGFNPAYSDAGGAPSAPVVIAALAGQSVTVTALGGTICVTSDCPSTGSPPVNAAGAYTVAPPFIGSWPGNYASPAVSLFALMGVFADDAGTIVGLPFAIGMGPFTTLAPVGATRLQLGVNDVYYTDNSGAWSVQVEVPEPGALPVMLSGLLGLGFLVRRRAGLPRA